MHEKVTEQVRKVGKPRRLWLVILCALVVTVAAVAFWPGEREPEYQGKKLSEWVLLQRTSPPRLLTQSGP